ncbi:MAG TPA: DNA polymerase III subunit delta [Kofleriaceae bacterium]|nr:DNA polymerase III subunit delta [Kofleriaceae bacterium]
MSGDATDELLAELTAGRLEPMYVLHSEHPILIERVLTAIRDVVVPPAARGFNYDIVEGKPSGVRIVALAQTLPMMAQRRLIYVRDLSAMPADDAEALLGYLAKPNPSTVIACVVTKLDKRIKLYAQLSRKGYLHVLEAPRQLAPWVRGEAKQQGVQLEPAAITRLIDAVGNDLSRLALTIEQLGLYAGRRAVTTADVDELVADTRERTVFELTDAIGAADRGRALAAVGALCDQRESAVGVVVMLARHVRQMSQVFVLRDTGAPRPSWGSTLGVPPFVVDKLIAQARAYSPAALAVATQKLANADRALKGDITLTSTITAGSPGGAFTGPQIKALGRDLAERIILETVVDSIVQLAG